MQTNAYDNVERQIAEHFGNAASQAPITSGFWPRLRARLDMPVPQRFGWLHALAARRMLVASVASVGVLAIVGALAVPAVMGGNDWPLMSRTDASTEPPRGPRGPAGAAGPTGLAVDMNAFSTTYGLSTRDQAIEFFSLNDGEGASPTLADTATPSALPVPSTTIETPQAGAADFAQQIENGGRSVISTSGLAIEVKSVPDALDRVRTITAAVGGFIESMSTTGGADPDRGSASLRVPGVQFASTLAQVKELGTVTGEQVTSDDVTDQVIDLEARLRSEQAKEVSFIELLDRATTVSDILSIERELSRVRMEIERLQGQLGFLEHRVDFSTINVNFGKPASLTAAPPSASLAIRTREVEDGVAQIKEIVKQAGGEIDNTSVSLRNDGLQAFVAFRVPPAEFDGVLFRVQQLGEVRAKEVREPGTAEDAEPAEDAVAKIDVTFSEPPPKDYNWWLIAGLPAGGVVAIVLIVLLAVWLTRRRAIQP